MATNLTQLGESVQHLAKAYRSVIDMGNVLREIGSLEQRAKDAEAAATVAAARNDEAQAALQTTLNGLATARDEVQKVGERIEQMSRGAHERIDARLLAAETEIAGKRAAAEDDIAAWRRDFAAEKQQHEAWRQQAADERNALAAEHMRVSGLIAELKAKLN